MELWRGKRAEDGKWIYGELIDEKTILDEISKKNTLVSKNSKSICTSYRDINNVLVYKEDIVMWENVAKEVKYGIVCLRGEDYVIESVDGDSVELDLIINNIKVVGNMFENSDILFKIKNKEFKNDLNSDINMMDILYRSLKSAIEKGKNQLSTTKIDNLTELLNSIKNKLSTISKENDNSMPILKTGRRIDTRDWVTGTISTIGGKTFLSNMIEEKTYEVDFNTVKDVESETLMRAKLVIEDNWVYGVYFKSKDGKDCIRDSKNGKEYEINKDTLGRHTGICTEGGINIYEGDVITWPSTEDVNTEDSGEVVYKDGKFIASIKYKNITLPLDELKEITVIISIHDL